MLQQTTVKTVIPYYKKFLKKFPTLHSLSKAKEADYLSLWAGLGYYNRIRNLHKACGVIINELKGIIPSTKEQLKKLPGLGDYTASAVASIAFGEPVSVVDGNVMRVISRLYAFEEDVKTNSAKIFFQEKSQALLDQKNPGDFNQAMMELGATVCTPRNPTCLLCPVQKFCKAKKNPEKFPVKTEKVKYRNEEWVGLIYSRENTFLLRRRGPTEIMQGLWEFPLQKKAATNFQGDWRQPIKHSIMSSRMTIYPCVIKENKKNKAAPSFLKEAHTSWILWNDLTHYPLTTITKKIMATLENEKLG